MPSRVDQSRTEQGARIHNKHVIGDTSGSGSVSSTVPASIELQVLLSVLTVGDSEQITAVIRNAAGAVLTVQPDGWSSANPSVVTVDGAGRITAVGAGGPVLITAVLSTYSLSASTPISSVAAPDLVAASVAVTPTTVSFQSGTAQLTAVVKNASGVVLNLTPTSWSSSSPSVATVSNTGLVTFVGVGTTNVQAHYNAIVSNTCAVTGVASGVVGSVLIAHDFEDGTIGPFYNPWGSGIDVVADPTARATGKVCRIHYANDPLNGFVDDNKAIFPTTPFSVAAGRDVWFHGDFHIPLGTNMDTSFCQRKLTYWGTDGFRPHKFATVIDSFGSQMTVVSRVDDTSAAIQNTVQGVTLVAGTWYRLKVQIRPNSAFSATDGIIRVWLDGVKVYEVTNMSWTNPVEWAGHDISEYFWSSWGVGYQINSPTGADTEYRYWDNVKFATTEAALDAA